MAFGFSERKVKVESFPNRLWALALALALACKHTVVQSRARDGEFCAPPTDLIHLPYGTATALSSLAHAQRHKRRPRINLPKPRAPFKLEVYKTLVVGSSHVNCTSV